MANAPSNHFLCLQYFLERGIPARGVVLDSRLEVDQAVGTYRNDTNRWLLMTGVYTQNLSVQGETQIAVGDRQMTGGLQPNTTLLTQSNSPSPLPWPGLAQPIPPGEQVNITVNPVVPSNQFTNYIYTAVLVEDPSWQPPGEWQEPRWTTLKNQRLTGQETPNFQIPYASILWDWVRGNPDTGTNYLSSTIIRFLAGTEAMTANSSPAIAVPASGLSPSALALKPLEANTTLWLYIDSRPVDDSPFVTVRLAKRWGDVG